MHNSKTIPDILDTLQKVVTECPEIVYASNPVLRSKTIEVDFKRGYVVGQYLITVLKKYRALTGIGRGLAAPQIGEDAAVFVTYIEDKFKIYINPRIIKKSTEQNLYREGCLSCAPMWADVKRSATITIEYTDEHGNFNIQEADGFLARLLQHEYDHLEGILNIDIAERGSIEYIVNDPLQEKIRLV